MSIVREHWVTSGDLILYARTEGNPEATPLVLVHGYPDNHTVWDKVTEQLKQDYLVVRYDVRGAGRSDKPSKTSAYRMKLLAGDLKSVVDTVIPDRPFHLVAHDWGAIQSWETVTTGALEGRIRSYTAISGPCLDHVSYWLRSQITALRSGGTAKVLKQLASSWYAFLFQLPVLPESLWKLGLDRLWPDYLRNHEQLAEAQFSPFQKADGQYGVKLYRANFLPKLLWPEPRRAGCPVQVIIPTGDAYVGRQLTEQLVRWTGKLTLQELNTTHWAPVTEPAAISRSVREFVNAHH
ncbi:alpha/beta fold hydrolase [Marinobacter halophilus]|uniref:Alpha/beta hydrolase n=1 Tax=Marinobacter halophilus TaxID=1323740 RepID=A0A2T1KF71_9GAMM|nr:alpha/beta fold hydrolase [Marinobacter halophilus]PSF08774.1 alpha/beta hydrolase [Marinobacter halophilus]GGC63701.1 hypothetical protein GCM10011362_10080 [Marinobacter halophilus]